MRVAILGTGRMGSAMARRLAEAGLEVSLWNRTGERARELARELASDLAEEPRVRAHAEAADAVAGCQVVLAVLADSTALESALLDDGLLDALPSDCVVCDMGTSGPETARRVAAAYAARGRAFVDSPVSGSVPSVMAGTLLVMASGAEADIARAEPALLSFAKAVARVGEAGAGQSMKLAVNLVVHALNGAVAEALALAEASGIATSDAYSVLLQSSVAAPYVGYKEAAFLSADAPVAMSIALMAKDLGLIAGQAERHGLDLRVLSGTRDEAVAAVDAGFGGADMAAVLRYLREACG